MTGLTCPISQVARLKDLPKPPCYMCCGLLCDADDVHRRFYEDREIEQESLLKNWSAGNHTNVDRLPEDLEFLFLDGKYYLERIEMQSPHDAVSALAATGKA